MPVVAIAAIAIAAGGAAASTAVKQDAERKAINKQQDAARAQQEIDIEKMKKLGAGQDIEHYLKSQEFFREQNPELAAARDLAAGNLLSDLQTGGVREQEALDRMFAENIAPTGVDALAEEIRRQAAEDLALGSQLPADFQAELVRLGLEEAGGAGIGFDPSGPVTQKLGTLTGQAGLALRQQRMGQAQQATQLGDIVRSNRQQILSGLINANQGVRAFQTGQATNALNIARAETPSIGLRGTDVVNLDLNNLAMRNAKLKEIARLDAEKALSKGRAIEGYINAGTQLAGGVLGGVTGGGGGIGSILGGGSSPISGLVGGGGGAQQVVYSPSFGTASAGVTGGPASFNRTPAQWRNFNSAQQLYEFGP